MSRSQPSTRQDRVGVPDGRGHGALVEPRSGTWHTSRPADHLTLSLDRPARGVVVVGISGDVDLASVPRLTELIRQRMTAANLLAVVLDLSDVAFVNSCGLELLLHAQRRADHRGIDLRLVTGGGCVHRLLELTRLTDRFTHHDSVAEALAAVQA